MEAVALLDTHVAVWLYAGNVELLSEKAAQAIETSRLLISPISILEVDYLHETGRIGVGGGPLLEELERSIHLEVAEDSFTAVARIASGLTWTRDPFDRLLVAHASLRQVPLVTKDSTLRRHYRCIW